MKHTEGYSFVVTQLSATNDWYAEIVRTIQGQPTPVAIPPFAEEPAWMRSLLDEINQKLAELRLYGYNPPPPPQMMPPIKSWAQPGKW